MILTAYGLAATLAVALAGAACTRDVHHDGDPSQVTTDSLSASRKLDVLFMIDNTCGEPSMVSLMQYFPNFATAVADYDLHIGIITSDMGSGIFTAPSCDTVGGDQGMLQNVPKGMGCSTANLIDPEARFLTYAPAPDGGDPITNFTGTLADAFTCYAAVGTGGCGFEHQLASIRAALDGCDVPGGCTQPANEGFLRPDARLGIVILTDEDDCSAPPDSTLFDPTQTTLAGALGPLTSYRCFEFGNLCNGADPGREEGPRFFCRPGNKDPSPLHQLIPVDDIATFLRALKPDPGSVYVAVIAGPPGPTSIGLDANGYPDLQPACTGGIGSADPAPRLAEFVRRLPPTHGRFFSVCQPDLSAIEATIGADLTAASTCLTGWPRNGNAASPAFGPECVVVERTPTGEEQEIPPCDPVLCDRVELPECACTHAIPGGAPACWYLWTAPACQLYLPGVAPAYTWQPLGAGLRLAVDRGASGAAATCNPPPAPAGTVTTIQCATCIAQPDIGVFDCSPGCADYWPDMCPTDGGS